MTAPIFDTVGGQVSPENLFKHLVELMQQIRDDFRTLGRLKRLTNDDSVALQWEAMAERFTRSLNVVNRLGTSRTKTGVGYGD